MSLGYKQSKTYLNIKEGKIFNQEAAYDYVEGFLQGIETKDREFRGEVVKYWYVNLLSPSGEFYSLALHYSSGVAKSLFNALASATSFSKPIKIQPYQSGSYTKVVAYIGMDKLSWKVSELPPVEEIKVGSRIVKDESKRMELIEALVTEINSKI
jgi:hypothetical protein